MRWLFFWTSVFAATAAWTTTQASASTSDYSPLLLWTSERGENPQRLVIPADTTRQLLEEDSLRSAVAGHCKQGGHFALLDQPGFRPTTADAASTIAASVSRQRLEQMWKQSRWTLEIPYVFYPSLPKADAASRESPIWSVLRELVRQECGQKVADEILAFSSEQDQLSEWVDSLESSSPEPIMFMLVAKPIPSTERRTKRDIAQAYITAQSSASAFYTATNGTTFLQRGVYFSYGSVMAMGMTLFVILLFLYALSWLMSVQAPSRFEASSKQKVKRA